MTLHHSLLSCFVARSCLYACGIPQSPFCVSIPIDRFLPRSPFHFFVPLSACLQFCSSPVHFISLFVHFHPFLSLRCIYSSNLPLPLSVLRIASRIKFSFLLIELSLSLSVSLFLSSLSFLNSVIRLLLSLLFL